MSYPKGCALSTNGQYVVPTLGTDLAGIRTAKLGYFGGNWGPIMQAASLLAALRLRSILPSSVHLHSAVKANPARALIQHMSHLVESFGVA